MPLAGTKKSPRMGIRELKSNIRMRHACIVNSASDRQRNVLSEEARISMQPLGMHPMSTHTLAAKAPEGKGNTDSSSGQGPADAVLGILPSFLGLVQWFDIGFVRASCPALRHAARCGFFVCVPRTSDRPERGFVSRGGVGRSCAPAISMTSLQRLGSEPLHRPRAKTFGEGFNESRLC